MADIADELGLGEQQVRNELKRYNDAELIAEVRNKLLATLDGAANVYADILDPATTPETLHKQSRGYKLKLDAANALNEGLGTFKRESTKTVKSTLEMIATEVEADGPRLGFNEDGSRIRPRVVYQPAALIEAEVTDVTGEPV